MELGHHVTRSTIADLEIGRRKHVLVSEMLVIAAALQVPPLQLLFPNLPFGDAEVLPGVQERSVDAAMWAVGLGALRQSSDHAQVLAEGSARITKLGGALRLLELEDQVRYTKEAFDSAQEEDRQLRWEQYASATDLLQHQMEMLGLVPRGESRLVRRREAYKRGLQRIGEQNPGPTDA